MDALNSPIMLTLLGLTNLAILAVVAWTGRKLSRAIEKIAPPQSTRRLADAHPNTPFFRINSGFRSIGINGGWVEIHEKGNPVPMRFELEALASSWPYALLRGIAQMTKLRVPLKAGRSDRSNHS